MKTLILVFFCCSNVILLAQKLVSTTTAPLTITTVLQKKADQVNMKEMELKATATIYNDSMFNGYILKKYDAINYDCIIMRKTTNKPFAVYGAIGSKYFSNNRAESIIGYPITDEAKMKDGAYQLFENGAIYWSPKTAAHIVRGSILSRYRTEKFANGFLGFPVNDVKITPDKKAAYCYFEGGCIYYNNAIGTFIIAGEILKTWAADKYETGFLGYPIAEAKAHKLGKKTDEITTWSQEFEGGMIVANVNSTKQYKVLGLNSKNLKDGPGIYSKYRALGGANSWLGIPVEEHKKGQGVWLQQFAAGYIYKKDNDIIGYTIRKGPIWNEFAKRKWEQGCGYPTADEQTNGNTTFQVFSKGTIYFKSDTNETTWKEGDNGVWYLDQKKDNKGAQSKF